MDKIERRHVISGATQDIKFFVDCGFLKNGQAWVSAWYGYDLKWSDGDSGYLTIPVSNVDPFVAKARESREVFRLAKFFAATRLKPNVGLPDPVAYLMAEFLAGDFVIPAGKAGRGRCWGRDFIIIKVMERLLLSHDISATANRQRRGVRDTEVSASEIVAEALKDIPEIKNLDIERIQSIWGCNTKRKEARDAYSHFLTGILDDEEGLDRI
jgi:hypothetical protein